MVPAERNHAHSAAWDIEDARSCLNKLCSIVCSKRSMTGTRNKFKLTVGLKPPETNARLLKTSQKTKHDKKACMEEVTITNSTVIVGNASSRRRAFGWSSLGIALMLLYAWTNTTVRASGTFFCTESNARSMT